MPVYNRVEFLQRSISSVLNQQFPDFELWCIDDGSTDNSKELIIKFQEKDPRIHLIELKENKGRCIARNKGIEKAQADWICFLDADDIYRENHLQVIRDLIKRHAKQLAFATEQTIGGQPKIYARKKHIRFFAEITIDYLIYL